MSAENKNGLMKREGLTQGELKEIKQLAQICNAYEDLDLKLNESLLSKRPETETNDFLYYADDILVGYLPMFAFNMREAEISGMVHPDYRRRGIFTALFNAAREEIQRRGIPRILLIVGHSSSAGQAFARTLETSYDHSEYKMVWEEANLPTQFEVQLEFRPAAAEDLAMLAQITAISFHIPEEEIDWYTAGTIAEPDRGYYVALLDGVCIGKIDVSYGKDWNFILGFGVLPEYRGCGYGRQILTRTIREILAKGQHNIALEVVTENQRALTLYQSCGFRETASDDYYGLATEK